MKHLLFLNNKKYEIRDMLTRDELEIAEYLYTTDITNENAFYCIDQILTKFDLPTDISDIEKLILILKIREQTFGSIIKVNYVCKNCEEVNEANLNVNLICRLAKERHPYIYGVYSVEEAYHLELETVLENNNNLEFLDDLDLDEYNDLLEHFTDYLDLYNFNQTHKCFKCNKEAKFSLSAKEILSFITEEDFKSICKSIHTLCYFEHNGRNDVLCTTPLQRLLELSNVTQTQKELIKAKEKKQKEDKSWHH